MSSATRSSPFLRGVLISSILHAGAFAVAASFAGKVLTVPKMALTVEFLRAGAQDGTGPAKRGAPHARRATQASRARPRREAGKAALPSQEAAVAPAQSTATVSSSSGAAEGAGPAVIAGGHGAGAGNGTPSGTGDGGGTVMAPRLLNREEVLRSCRLFYPDAERRARREGTVLLALDVGIDGLANVAAVLNSAGPTFDAAALRVAALMRFAPGRDHSGLVAVRVSQPVAFRLR